MAVNNSLSKTNQKVGITAFLNSAKVLENVEQALGKAQINQSLLVLYLVNP